MTTLNLIKQTKKYACAALLLSSIATFAQDPIATDNVEIAGVELVQFFAEQTDGTNTNFATNSIDDDVTTKWAANTINDLTDGEEPSLIFKLGAGSDLTEIQYLSEGNRSFPYAFQIFVSTTVTEDYTEAVFTNPFEDQEDADGNLLSNLVGTYTNYVLATAVEDVTFVKYLAYGRPAEDSGWNTIYDIVFYAPGDATASTIDEELSNASIYPNPVNNALSLDNINDRVNKVEVLSLDGRVLLSQAVENSDATIDTSSLANGVYFLNFSNTSSNLNSSKTIIVQH